MSDHSSRIDLLKVAQHLGELREDVVFVGGCAVVFLVPKSSVASIRPTEDVDCILKVASRAQYYREVVERLRSLGFSECTEAGAPICRWVIEGISVDVMPTSEEVLGFTNRWYDFALTDPIVLEPIPNVSIRVINHVAFLATKFEAFGSRGRGEYEGNTDIEDILSVLAYCPGLEKRIKRAPRPIRDYLKFCALEFVALRNLAELVSAALPADRVSQSAVPAVLEILRSLADERELGTL